MAAEMEDGLAHQLDHFSELLEVTTLIKTIESICHDDILLEAAEERFIVILNKYQEQPHLLDPNLESLVQKLQNIVRDSSNPAKVIRQAFKYLYLITKVRGPKYVVRLFAHEVADVEPVLGMLSQQNPQDHETWETRYVLLLWLSIVCMIPFDMARFDGLHKEEAVGVVERRRPVVERILETAKAYLAVPDKSRDSAALVISKFVTRPDVKKERLPEYLDWSLFNMEKATEETLHGMLLLTGILTTLALLFKHGKREDLIPFASTVLKQIGACQINSTKNTLLRKLTIKLIQRLGLTFLRPRVANWRYQRGSRSLTHNLANPFTKEQNEGLLNNQGSSIDEEEEYDVPEELEEVIEKLLAGLKDKDTVVRWSAAKGVGRITGRLPQELADQIVENVLELFSFRESDSGWHGGCLALAELGRRGLLLPHRLPEVVPAVIKALSYDELRGYTSVGSHVRDGACYVCWSFARAYDPKEIQPHVCEIARALVTAALFDREVNCRRAASAAFQENVGRQGSFPHGIDILTLADYYAVGNRTNTYLSVSVSIAQFVEYTRALIDNLCDVRLQHWDCNIRELASQALHNLTPTDPEYMAKTVLPKMLSKTSSIDLNTGHGNILGCAEVVYALRLWAEENTKLLTEIIDDESLDALKHIVPKLTAEKRFRGLGGEFMRRAVCHLIQKLSMSKLSCHDQIIEIFQSTIDDNLSHTEPEIQEGAVRALSAVCQQSYVRADGTAIEGIQDKIITKYVEQLKSPSEFSRVGFSQALGSLPKFMLKSRLKVVFEGLISATQVANDPGKFAESRRDALKALARIACTVGLSRTGDEREVVTESGLRVLYEAFFVALSDYTIDSRGDVGAWVREASMTGLETLTCFVVKTDPSLLTPHICWRVMECLTQQASEKIDRTRAHAGEIFLRLLYMDSPPVPHIPHFKELLEIFPRSNCLEMNWRAPGDCFPRLTKLLALPSYRRSVLLGLTVSVGGLTESLVRHSHYSLLAFIRTINNSEKDLNAFAETILEIYETNQKNDRVIVPLFKMLDMLFSNGCFELFAGDENHPFPQNLLMLTKKEIFKLGDAKKLITSVSVFCGLLQFPGVTRSKSFQQLSLFLCHKYPQVRKTTADQLYSAVLTYDDILPAERLDEVLALLSETSWDAKIEELRVTRNKLCDMIGIPHPVLKSSATKSVVNRKADELESYKDLVTRDY
ncbi:tubulin-specific chaperone D-like [Acropora muricata]|uniref:tubulin-specific chaperone D-like n=1 Tax=Acropora muricata TaxID=159855 RepID=UPI0034E3B3B9